MSAPIFEDSSQVNKLSEFSNCFGSQVLGVNMVWPTEISNQRPTENSSSYPAAAPTQQTSHQVQVHQFINPITQGQPLNYNSSSHHYFTMYAGSPSFVMTDLRRIQGMETTIEYQRELLSKEFTKNIKSNQIIEEMKKELETSNEKNKHLQEQLQAALKSVKETQIEKGEMNCVLEDFVAAQKALSANQKELLDAQSELVIARNSISDLKAIKTDLESKVDELSKLNYKLSLITSLPVDSVKVEKSMSDGENDFAALKRQYELHKEELITITEKKNIISDQFKELGKKYLYIIEYSGEQMYNEYVEKHVEFIKKLESLNTSASETQSSKINQMLVCLQGQVESLKECRENFRVTIELLLCRIDQEFALVSDLSIRAQKPSFEIPLEDFDLLFQVIAGIGSVELECEQKHESFTY